MRKKDFFISYTCNDEEWAKWIAGTLESHDYTTIIQVWDFKPGKSFVCDMNKALNNCKRFIIVLSKEYLESAYCQAEWQNAFTKDPTGEKTLLIPVRISDVKPQGLLASRIYIDLFGKTEEESTQALVNGVSTKDRPRNMPSFPGTRKIVFPGELPFNNLPLRNPYFTGRRKVLETIHQTFQEDKIISLTQTIKGLGGVGKTAIAKEYAFRYAQEYNCIWWVNAESETSILSAYSEFALKKKIVDSDKSRQEVIIEAVRYWMGQNDKWLFIFDNAEDTEHLKKYLPADHSEHRHILITSRNIDWKRIATIVDTKVFSLDEAIEFLDKYTQLPEKEKQAELAKALGCLPLALEQAATYIYNVIGTTYANYLDKYNRYRLKILEKYPNEESKTVCATWNISFEKITNESAKQLFNFCSFFAPEKIPYQWFSEAAECLPQPLQATVAEELQFDEIRAELTKYSLINIENNRISMHRLLQEVVRDTLKEERETWIDYCTQIFYKSINPDFSTIDRRNNFMEMVPHIIYITEISFLKTIEIANLYLFLGYGFIELGNHFEALKWYKKALVVFEKKFGKEHPDTAIIYNNIAEVYSIQGNYPEALEWYKKALVIFERVLGKKNSITATTYDNIAKVYLNQGKYPETLEWYKKGLAIFEKVLGKKHPDTAVTYSGIATAYYCQGNYFEALKWYEKSLVIREKVLGKKHPDTANTYNNIATVYSSQGKYPEALELHKKTLAIYEKVLGKEHLSTANTYNNLATVYTYQGKYSEALIWHKKALVIHEKILGTEHPNTATMYDNLAGVYINQGNYSEALRWQEKALVIKEKVLGKEHPDVAVTYNNMAAIFYKQNNYSKALKWYKKALVIVEKRLGKEHPNTIATYNNIASVYSHQGNYSEALKLFLKSYKISLSTLESTHPTITTMKNNRRRYNATNNTIPFEKWLQQEVKDERAIFQTK
jgi:tetratricopeptide (TPR) repeat protein